MTALRQQAFDMLQAVPEDKMVYIIDILKGFNGAVIDKGVDTNKLSAKNTDRSKKLAAWENLKKYRGVIDRDIDIKAELAEARDEKNARFD